jgi:hypothetical protein
MASVFWLVKWGEACLSLGSNDRRRALTGQVVRVTTVGKEGLYAVGIPTRSEAELAVAKYLQTSDHLSIKAIERLSASAVKALGLGPGEIRLR